jgi:hypothetical protein
MWTYQYCRATSVPLIDGKGPSGQRSLVEDILLLRKSQYQACRLGQGPVEHWWITWPHCIEQLLALGGMFLLISDTKRIDPPVILREL